MRIDRLLILERFSTGWHIVRANRVAGESIRSPFLNPGEFLGPGGWGSASATGFPDHGPGSRTTAIRATQRSNSSSVRIGRRSSPHAAVGAIGAGDGGEVEVVAAVGEVTLELAEGLVLLVADAG